MAKKTFNSPSELPSWRIDNIISFILIIGSFFVYLVRLSVVETKVDIMLATQKEMYAEIKENRKVSDKRLSDIELQYAGFASAFNNHLVTK